MRISIGHPRRYSRRYNDFSDKRTMIHSYKRNSRGKTLRKRVYKRPFTKSEIRSQNIAAAVLGTITLITVGGMVYSIVNNDHNDHFSYSAAGFQKPSFTVGFHQPGLNIWG
jgi:hypothetical protein